jgi:adhesin transport system outer membrane protein
LDQSLTVHDRLLAQVKRRAEEGLSAQSDIQLAQSRHAAVVAERAYAAAQRDTALQKLQTLAGRRVKPDEVQETSCKLQGNSPASCPLSLASDSLASCALKLDPELARLNAEVASLEASARQSQAALWPEVYARADQRRGDITGNTTQILVALESRWGAGLSTPSAIASARHRVAAKRSEIEVRQRKLTEQIQSDRQLFEAARLRVQALQAAQDAALEVSTSWDRQFLAGKKSWQDVMNAAREAAQTEIQLADAQAAVIVTGWRLAVLTQGVEQIQGASCKLEGNSLEP